MSKGKKRMHGYDAATLAMLKGVALPPKLKCGRCQKHKGYNSFSETQLNHARMALKKKNDYTIKCHHCAGGRIMEIECSYCNKTKGLEHFAKSQRSDSDSNRCYDCTESQVTTVPVQDERYEHPREAFAPVENSDGTWPQYWEENGTTTNASEAGDDTDAGDGGGISLLTNMHNLSIQTATLIESDDLYSTGSESHNNSNDKPVRLGGDEWTVAQTKSWNTRSANPSSSFNASRHGNSAARGGASSLSGTARTFNSNYTEPSNQPSTGKWAKIKAYVPQQSAEPGFEQDWSSESEKNSDDDDDDDDDIEI